VSVKNISLGRPRIKLRWLVLFFYEEKKAKKKPDEKSGLKITTHIKTIYSEG
jgi:hypothetical protein